MKNEARRLLAAVMVVGAATSAAAQTRPSDLALVALEDLMNMEITSASRKEQRAEDVPAAVYVITQDDIRRSGMTSLPDLLRLVPGVQVGQINANKWAVSVRGFNSLYSNKLLVMVDGRSLYNPLFSGVLWDTEDLMLEDVDRIEVIRGPGAAIWGANAVNGVINILTKPSKDTQGLLVRLGAGTAEGTEASVRYGGSMREGTYRLFTQLSNHSNSTTSGGAAANDHWSSLTSGFRTDWTRGVDAFLVQGGLTAGSQRPLWLNLDPVAIALGQTGNDDVSVAQVGNVFGRWTRTRDARTSWQLQSYVDLAHRKEAIGEYQRQTFDLDAEYHGALGARHDFVVGGGYRFIAEAMDGAGGYTFNPSRAHEQLLNAFAQDEIALHDRVKATIGVKFEHDTLAGSGIQPTARVIWTFAPQQRVWGAVSRALRTPSLIDRGLDLLYPPMPQPDGTFVVYRALGNPNADNEQVLSTEFGYRLDVRSNASIDVTTFVGRYDGLLRVEPVPPTLSVIQGRAFVTMGTQFQNSLDATTSGAELVGRVKVTKAWQLDGSFAAFHLNARPRPTSVDPTAAGYDGYTPAYQWRGHSALSLGPRAQTDVLVFYVGSIDNLAIPAYTRADARFELKLTRQLSLQAQGQNLFSRAHPEFNGNDTNIVATLVPRNVSVRATWGF